MEHFNKNTFIGATLWSSINILRDTPKDVKEFTYSVEDKNIYCQDYGSTFAIQELPSEENKGLPLSKQISQALDLMPMKENPNDNGIGEAAYWTSRDARTIVQHAKDHHCIASGMRIHARFKLYY